MEEYLRTATSTTDLRAHLMLLKFLKASTDLDAGTIITRLAECVGSLTPCLEGAGLEMNVRHGPGGVCSFRLGSYNILIHVASGHWTLKLLPEASKDNHGDFQSESHRLVGRDAARTRHRSFFRSSGYVEWRQPQTA